MKIKTKFLLTVLLLLPCFLLIAQNLDPRLKDSNNYKVDIPKELSLEPVNEIVTYEKNLPWLKSIKDADKIIKWKEIEKRFFNNDSWGTKGYRIEYAPIVTINGILFSFTDKLTKGGIKDILGIINGGSINEINIIETVDNWSFCGPFPGIIEIVVSNRTAKKIFRIKN